LVTTSTRIGALSVSGARAPTVKSPAGVPMTRPRTATLGAPARPARRGGEPRLSRTFDLAAAELALSRLDRYRAAGEHRAKPERRLE
jgi:hypothetical protein